MTRRFGHISGTSVGDSFLTREELRKAGIHPPPQAGISGGEQEGADSIVLSGGYEDDEDRGDMIIYTGQGGRDPSTGVQVADQPFTLGNRALALSQVEGLPVRVTRGHQANSPYAPPVGYRYDGLFRVADRWQEKGAAGFTVWRFRLEKIDEDEPRDSRVSEGSEGEPPELPERVTSEVSRIIRDTRLSRGIKRLYGHRCQVCLFRFEGPGGPYAEAAHIKPLGRPHNGPDTKDNLLCLCPNHHVMFDFGGFAISDNFDLIGIEGRLEIHSTHTINLEYIGYHRARYGSQINSDG